RGSASLFFNIRSFVNPGILIQSILKSCVWHKLPNTFGCSRRYCQWFPNALDLGQPDHILWNAFFLKYLLGQLAIPSRALQTMFHRGAAATFRKVGNELRDGRGNLKIEIVLARF